MPFSFEFRRNNSPAQLLCLSNRCIAKSSTDTSSASCYPGTAHVLSSTHKEHGWSCRTFNEQHNDKNGQYNQETNTLSKFISINNQHKRISNSNISDLSNIEWASTVPSLCYMKDDLNTVEELKSTKWCHSIVFRSLQPLSQRQYHCKQTFLLKTKTRKEPPLDWLVFFFLLIHAVVSLHQSMSVVCLINTLVHLGSTPILISLWWRVQ